ncbi:organic cation transporter protein-like isoform X2 [Antedon mediterranea]|uniref:organic cation transporter protein-like isoform X2 n=1 Tax=Antedon mediterranea TaxID=105859 RepID=UPI003AF65C01
MELENQSNKLHAEKFHFDDIFKYIGSCNKYLFVSFVTASLCITSIGWNSLAVVFLFPEIDFWCNVEELNDLCTERNFTDVECRTLKLENRPVDNENTPLKENQCSKYNFTNLSTSRNSSIHRCGNGYEFDTTKYLSSVTQEFNLVCEDAYLIPLMLSLTYFGVLLGALIFGNVSDRLGRKKTLVLCMCMYSVCLVVKLLSQEYWMFLISATIAMIFIQGAYLTTFVLGCELVGPSIRSFAGTFIGIQWAIGYMLASLYAYLIPYWRYMLLAMLLTDIAMWILICLVVTESPRWLHARNRMGETEVILKRACRSSKEPQESIRVSQMICATPAVIEKSSSDFKPRNLLRMKNLWLRFFLINFIWFVNSLVYYGLSLSAVTLGSNDYVANVLAGLVEIPAAFLGWIAMERMGRRPILSAAMVLAGIACASSPFLSNSILGMISGLVGKFSISISFTIIYIVASEVYPTPIRNTALGLSSTIGNLGAISAPQILYAGVLFEQLPYLIFGGLTLVAGIITWFLPETRGLNLPHSLVEGENLGM